MDKLIVQGIRAYGYTGYFAAEQELGQWFEVELMMQLDLMDAGDRDELAATVNYAQAVQLVQSIIQTSKFKTIERLSTVIAEKLLTELDMQTIRVRLTKCTPPIPDFSGQVTIEIERSR